MEAFTRECLTVEASADGSAITSSPSDMSTVYKNAAMLLVNTLGLHGAAIADISTFAPPKPVVPSNNNSSSSLANTRSESYESMDAPRTPLLEFSDIPSLSILALSTALGDEHVVDMGLSPAAQLELRTFLTNHPDGQIYEAVVPSCFHGLVPRDIDYAMSTSFTSLK